MDLLTRIKNEYNDMSKSHKRIADYFLNNYDNVAFMTASQIASCLTISESTVVRFAKIVGYPGYPALQKALRDAIKNKLTTVERFARYKGGKKDLRRVMAIDIENVRHIIDNFDSATMNAIIKEIIKAKKVYVLGLRSSSVLANYLGFYLNFLIPNIHVISESARDVYDQIIHMGSDDVLITFSFPRYSKRTYHCVDYAKSQNVTILGITDGVESPLFSRAKHCLTVKYSMKTFVDSLTAPMSLVNALIVGVSLNVEKVENKLDKLENIWQNYGIYE